MYFMCLLYILITPSSICSIWHTLNVTKLHCDIVTLPREQSGACFNSCDFEHLRKKNGLKSMAGIWWRMKNGVPLQRVRETASTSRKSGADKTKTAIRHFAQARANEREGFFLLHQLHYFWQKSCRFKKKSYLCR